MDNTLHARPVIRQATSRKKVLTEKKVNFFLRFLHRISLLPHSTDIAEGMEEVRLIKEGKKAGKSFEDI